MTLLGPPQRRIAPQIVQGKQRRLKEEASRAGWKKRQKSAYLSGTAQKKSRTRIGELLETKLGRCAGIITEVPMRKERVGTRRKGSERECERGGGRGTDKRRDAQAKWQAGGCSPRSRWQGTMWGTMDFVSIGNGGCKIIKGKTEVTSEVGIHTFPLFGKVHRKNCRERTHKILKRAGT